MQEYLLPLQALHFGSIVGDGGEGYVSCSGEVAEWVKAVQLVTVQDLEHVVSNAAEGEQCSKRHIKVVCDSELNKRRGQLWTMAAKQPV